LLLQRYEEQDGRCFYCLRATWILGVERKSAAWQRLGVLRSQLDGLQATREHLKRRVDGGAFNPSNIVMACFQCNTDGNYILYSLDGKELRK